MSFSPASSSAATPSVVGPWPGGSWLASWDNVVEAQRFWQAAILPWYQALLAAQREQWDRWTCQWTGGVPIDG